MRLSLLRCYLVILGLSLFKSTWASPSAALGYSPKYPADFAHFDYVNPHAPQRGELILAGLGNFDSLNPFLLKSIPAEGLGNLMFESLMEKSQDEPFSMYGLLAQEIELSKDNLSVMFHLNPKARFSDGSEVTAEDVKFSFDTLKSEKAHPQYRFYWKDIQKAEVIDSHTIRFNFAKVNPEIHLIAAEIPIFSKASLGQQAFDQRVTQVLVTTGPYVIEKYEIGKYITFKRQPNYWGKELNTRRGMYNFDRITYKYYKDMEVALEAFKAGEFDFMGVYNSKAWAREYVGPPFDAGKIKKEELPHQNNAGMQGFVFNLRRPLFQDIKVRQAINLAFDFEWANENLFYKQYQRCDSYFSNSELAAKKALPEKEELVLLKEIQNQFPQQFPKEVLTKVWQPVNTHSPSSLRENLRTAKAVLTEAGWMLNEEEGILKNHQGVKLEFEVLLVQSGFDRILAPFARNLKKLGIQLNYRTVDRSLYQRKQDTFDFDMLVHIFGQSQSPGNELMNTWHSSSALQEGSNNLIGLKNPVVDALIEKIIYAPNRKVLLTAVHALDRVMLFGEYVIPNWYIGVHRVAYWDKFGRPEKLPLYYQEGEWMLRTWWNK